jgi:AI-2 transport protein TqsA
VRPISISSTATRLGIGLLVLLAGVVLLRLGEALLIPTVIAVLLAAMLWPAAGWLHLRLRLPWSLACFTVIGLLLLMNLLVTLGFALAFTRFVQELPRPYDREAQEQVYRNFRDKVNKSFGPLPDANEYLPADPESSRAFQYVRQTIESPYMTEALLKVAWYANNWLWQWILIMFILLFLLLEGRMLSRRVVEIFGPSQEAQDKAVAALSEMARQVRTYLVWRTIVNFGLGLAVGVVYHLLHLNHAWTWALLTAVFCYVPYIGPILAGAPPILDAFIGQGPWHAAAIFVFYLAIITLEGYVIVPVVMGRHMELNGTTVMLACLFWELVWGLPGLFLAMPLMAAVKAICYHVPGWRPWANLMGTRESDPIKADEEEEESLEATLLLPTVDGKVVLDKEPLEPAGKRKENGREKA